MGLKIHLRAVREKPSSLQVITSAESVFGKETSMIARL
jgi:hypothetical protein